MCGANPSEALGLPPGSVRAILALICVPPILLGSLALMIMFFWKEQYTNALGILSGLTGVSGTIVGYYFGNKATKNATDEIIKAHNNVSEAQKQVISVNREIIENHREVISNKDREINVLQRNLDNIV